MGFNRHSAVACCPSMIFSDLPSSAEASTETLNYCPCFTQAENRVSTFRDHALAFARIPPRAGQRTRRPTRTQPQRSRRLSAARDVVLDNQKATIWLESGARLALRASTYSCTRVDELGTNRVRIAQLSCVDSGAGGNRMLFRAARRGGTFRLSRAAFERAALQASLRASLRAKITS